MQEEKEVHASRQRTRCVRPTTKKSATPYVLHMPRRAPPSNRPAPRGHHTTVPDGAPAAAPTHSGHAAPCVRSARLICVVEAAATAPSRRERVVWRERGEPAGGFDPSGRDTVSCVPRRHRAGWRPAGGPTGPGQGADLVFLLVCLCYCCACESGEARARGDFCVLTDARMPTCTTTAATAN